ncbi:MAG: Vacuolar protein sorting-associated protein 20 [Phylliscum demangeonii]|nr:MAG: Vacuolar protein sorting-associated protein 20 [Phylliscum demangeonii]
MGNTTSKGKITARDRAILDMKAQRDKLHQYQKKISVLTRKETEIAKRLVIAGDRPRALLALRRKKYQETLLAKTDSQLEQLEALTADVEFALVQKDVLFGLQQGTRVLRQIHAEMGGLDRVEQMMADGEEARAYQQEISDMLGGTITNQDEDEVEQELSDLEEELFPSLPRVESNPSTEYLRSALEPPMPPSPILVPHELVNLGEARAGINARGPVSVPVIEDPISVT